MATNSCDIVKTAVGASRSLNGNLRSLPKTHVMDFVTFPSNIVPWVEAHGPNSVGRLITGCAHAVNPMAHTTTNFAIGPS